MDFETTVKMQIYESIAATTRAPSSSDVARAVGARVKEVEAAMQSLAEKRLLVLEPGTTSRIRMAPPFSGIPTPFRVSVGSRSYFANCVWDALGVPAALHRDGDVQTTDGYSGEPMSVRVRDGEPVPQSCLAHFAVPAAQWWDDIIHT